MRVACTRCKTAYDIPPEKLTDEVLKIRCSRCGHVFGVRKKKDAPAPPPEAAAMGTAAPPLTPAADESPPRPVTQQFPEESFEKEDSDDIHWLDEIDIPKIEDVIEAVQKKMAAAATPLAPAAIPVESMPPAAPEAATGGPAPSPRPPTPAVPPVASRDAGGSPHPSAPPLPKAPPVAVPHRPPPKPLTAGEEAPARPAPGTERPSREPPQPPPAGEPPQAAPALPRRRFSAAGVVLLISFLLCAGSAGFVSATRPETFAFLASRLTNPLASADAGIVIDEPVVAAQISRPDKRPLFVVTGWVRSRGKPLPAEVRVEARVYGVRGVELASGYALCGALLTEEDLVALADSEIVSRLHRPSSGGGTPSRVPFMIVIPDPPRGIEGHAERILPPGGGG